MRVLLFDTCILIDILRRNTDALAFFEAANGQVLDGQYDDLAISVLTVQELYSGIRPGEEAATERLLSAFQAVEVDTAIARLSGDYLRRYFRSHGVQSNDSLIAATAAVTSAELATCNLKHFPMFPDLERPY